MAQAAIRIEGLWKEYVIGGRERGHQTFREMIVAVARAPFQKSGPAGDERFWALQDISLDVMPGQTVGIIGRNGAGKSTLLKVLSRITDPTRGSIFIRGRVASLLEVGTGFHPELTGRENVFLNGAILGMRRREIVAKFDEIVAFAEVEKFIDTPVKRYSSGMYVRLAFSVAAHLEAETLVVDEVLAVGDTAFQQKCLAKMDGVAQTGRAVLFVSHNLSALQRLCESGVLLQGGRLVDQGSISRVVETYQRQLGRSEVTQDIAGSRKDSGAAAQFIAWAVAEPGAESLHACTSRDHCTFRFTLRVNRTVPSAYLGFAIWGVAGELIVAGSSSSAGPRGRSIEPGIYKVDFRVHLPIRPGLYQLDVSLNSYDAGVVDRWHAVPTLSVLPHADVDPGLPEQWRGLLDEDVQFSMVRDKA